MAQSVSETVIAHKMLSHWNCLLHFGICSIFLRKATEVNATKFVVIKRTKVNQEKTWKNRKLRGQKTAEKGGKTAEKDGLWKWRSKSCRKHVQKVLSRIVILLVFVPVVKLCWKLQSKWLNVDVSQHLKCATMKTCIATDNYLERFCFSTLLFLLRT